jgi:hypothetical protein
VAVVHLQAHPYKVGAHLVWLEKPGTSNMAFRVFSALLTLTVSASWCVLNMGGGQGTLITSSLRPCASVVDSRISTLREEHSYCSGGQTVQSRGQVRSDMGRRLCNGPAEPATLRQMLITWLNSDHTGVRHGRCLYSYCRGDTQCRGRVM